MKWVPAIILCISMIRCANVIPPEGGPRDTIPPTLIKSLPSDNSKNFSGNRITLEFNEWIQLRNPKEDIVITPSMGKNTKFTFKKNIFTIEPEFKLDSATTYSLSFREVVQDLNEGNPAEGLKLAFSTGPILDSLKIFGRVYSILEGADLEKFNVAIYTADTFDITKHQPAYISRTDKKGRFTITNLKPAEYYIYAWDDKNKNLKVETNTERFGTTSGPIRLPDQKDSVKIGVVKLDSRPLKFNNYRNISNYTIIRLNKAPVEYEIKSQHFIKSHYGTSANEIIAYPPNPYPDSTQLHFAAIDSLGNKIDSIFFIKQTKSKPIKETFNAKITTTKYTSSAKSLISEVTYSLPIKTINHDSIEISLDTIPFVSLTPKDLTVDSVRKTLYINKPLTLTDSLLKKSPKLIIKTGSLISIFNDTLRTIEQRIIPKIDKELATVTLTSKTKMEGWIIEAVDDKFNIIHSMPHSKNVTFKGLDPTPIRFRAYNDLNRNNKWDINNPLKRDQPESYIYYKNEKGQTSIPLRANWTVELEWNF